MSQVLVDFDTESLDFSVACNYRVHLGSYRCVSDRVHDCLVLDCKLGDVVVAFA